MWHSFKSKKNRKHISKVIQYPPLNTEQVRLILNSDTVQFLTPFIIEVSRRN
jgi:hypothetical protein